MKRILLLIAVLLLLYASAANSDVYLDGVLQGGGGGSGDLLKANNLSDVAKEIQKFLVIVESKTNTARVAQIYPESGRKYGAVSGWGELIARRKDAIDIANELNTGSDTPWISVRKAELHIFVGARK